MNETLLKMKKAITMDCIRQGGYGQEVSDKTLCHKIKFKKEHNPKNMNQTSLIHIGSPLPVINVSSICKQFSSLRLQASRFPFLDILVT